MHNIFKKLILNLQWFAEGASGDGAGEGSTGVSGAATPDAAGQSRSLEDLGVPKDKAERYRARKGTSAPVAQNTGTDAVAPQQAAAAEEPAPQEDPDAVWKEAMKNPVINRKMQETVQSRVKGLSARLQTLEPLLEIVGRKAGIDTSDMSKVDIQALVNAVEQDPSYYEDLAADMGVDTQTAMRVDQTERMNRRLEAQNEAQIREQQIAAHFDGLKRQASELQQQGYPINLEQELEDEWFFRVTRPEGGLTVKQAYDAKYHDQMMQAKTQQTIRAAQTQISNSIQSGMGRPVEAGTVARGASPTTTKLYSQMSKEERAAYKKQLMNNRR